MSYLTYPLNNIDYDASEAETYLATRTSGVYAKNSFQYSVKNTDTNITIGNGLAWIKNHEFAGKVFRNSGNVTLNCGASNANYPRYDIIAIRFSKTANTTTIVVKQGTARTSPQYPAISQTTDVYELYLYAIYRPAGVTNVTEANITDLRLSQYCGLMADSITEVDTSAIERQVTALLNGLITQSGLVKKSDYDAKVAELERRIAELEARQNITVTSSGTTLNITTP